jgi:hypothetical protein
MEKTIMEQETPEWIKRRLIRKKARRNFKISKNTRKSFYYCYCFRAKKIQDFSRKKYDDDDFSSDFANLFDGGIDFSEALQTLFNN